MKAIILAGGLGTRLSSVVSDVPKPMAPISGRPFLEYLLDYWLAQGVDHVVFSIGYKADVIKGHFGNSYRKIPLTYAVESKQLGTGGGVLLSMKVAMESDPLLVINGDTYFEVDLLTILKVHEERLAAVTMSLLEVFGHDRSQAVELDKDFGVIGFNASELPSQKCFINGGVCLIRPSAFRGLKITDSDPVSFEDDLLQALINKGQRVVGCPSPGRFFDIGTPEDYARASSFLGLPSGVLASEECS